MVFNLAPRLSSRLHHVVCYDRSSSHVSGAVVDNMDEYQGVKITRVWTVEKKGLATMTSSFSAAIRASISKVDVVHIHAEGPAAMCWIPKFAGKRVICTIHGDAQIISRKGWEADIG